MTGFLLLTGLISWALTGAFRRYALAKSLLDIPNERSSHTVPTPRGGGVAFVIVFLPALFFLYLAGLLSLSLLYALLGSGTLVAITGFLDDRAPIAARWRLLLHFIAAGWGLYWLGGAPTITIGSSIIDLGWLGQALSLIYLVWLLNLYNFMDGIDGIAGIEAVTVSLGGALLILLNQESAGLQWPLVLLSITVAGFLLWNFPVAKIFMGDAGSGFLGIMLGLFSIQAAWVFPHYFWSWLILLGVFIVDATVTLLRRWLRGEKIYQAHCDHAYQFAARLHHAHHPVSLAVAAINIFWLMPLALWVGSGSLDGLLGVFIAYTPLVLMAFHFQAGARNIEQ